MTFCKRRVCIMVVYSYLHCEDYIYGDILILLGITSLERYNEPCAELLV